MKRTFVYALLVLLVGTLAPDPTHGGPAMPRRTYLHKEFGFRLLVVPDWEEVPVRPDYKTAGLAARFQAETREDDFAMLDVYRFDLAKGPALPKLGDLDPASLPKEELEKLLKEFGIPTNALDALEKMVKSLADGKGPKLPRPKKVRLKKGTAERYTFELKSLEYRSVLIVAAIARREKEEYLIFFTCPLDKRKKWERGFAASIKSFKFPDPAKTASSRDEDEEDWGDSPLVGAEKRAKVKAELVRGWHAIDTPHYIVIYNCDRRLAMTIARRVERMRRHCYEKWFPPRRPISDCMVVRVCSDWDTYHSYGGPRGTGGYWYAAHDELVFPDTMRSKKPDEKTLGILHHEGWHQYLHYSLGKDRRTPIAMNEGIAEVFFCARPGGGRMKLGARHPFRYNVVKTAAATGKLVPFSKFMRLTQKDHYANSSLHYAEGWALFHWLLLDTKNEAYRAFPKKLYEALREHEWKKAIDIALEGIDEEKLHADFVKALEGF